MSNDLLTGPTPDPTLDYVIVDVFVGADERPFTGNPLAVVLGADGLTTEQCQALAVEFHLSETVFPLTPTGNADYRARIFTISGELPFAGHPSVGAAWVLGRLGLLKPGQVTQECGVGLVTLDLPPDGGAITLTGPLPAVGEPLDPAPLLAAMRLRPQDLVGPPPRTCGTGAAFTFLRVRPEALSVIRPNLEALTRLESQVTGLMVVAMPQTTTSDEPLQIRARMFASDIGGEDPATGSAALALAGWLVASGVVSRDGVTEYVIAQGVEMGRPSELRCDVTADDGEITQVRVSGRVAPVASGRIRRP